MLDFYKFFEKANIDFIVLENSLLLGILEVWSLYPSSILQIFKLSCNSCIFISNFRVLYLVSN